MIAACREEGEQLWAALGRKDEAAARRVLDASGHPGELAFRKRPAGGDYAIHAAVKGGMHKLATVLAQSSRYPGVLQQQDADQCALHALAM